MRKLKRIGRSVAVIATTATFGGLMTPANAIPSTGGAVNEGAKAMARCTLPPSQGGRANAQVDADTVRDVTLNLVVMEHVSDGAKWFPADREGNVAYPAGTHVTRVLDPDVYPLRRDELINLALAGEEFIDPANGRKSIVFYFVGQVIGKSNC